MGPIASAFHHSANGIRTRVWALRGPRPSPLDDSAVASVAGRESAGAELATRDSRPATPRHRPGRNRTCNPRFWRPVLYHLSYGPLHLHGSGLPGWLTGLEPATSGATVRRSNRLSYNHHGEPGPRSRAGKTSPAQGLGQGQKRARERLCGGVPAALHAIQRGHRHHPADRVGHEQWTCPGCPPAWPSAPRSRPPARRSGPPHARQDAELERRRRHPAVLPPEHAPDRSLRHLPAHSQQQPVVRPARPSPPPARGRTARGPPTCEDTAGGPPAT